MLENPGEIFLTHTVRYQISRRFVTKTQVISVKTVHTVKKQFTLFALNLVTVHTV